ncbi:Ger(x)C family spore germination protein [Paenibacillus sp. CF384]|uniref:Ger(x)C family spore germination protein n=1 Tax=Paenibacillus sp. CF384 TaxID=1884382 RepID=UPI00089470E8|nr:Ger(x)C family spore germination protein [Paenibacillus sp. CF384]SDX70931.1 germination protein, Ger(x)C family [Paenibacillus sp. CF384]
MGCRIYGNLPLLLLALSMLLASCGNGQFIDQIEIVQTAGYDKDDRKVLTSVLIGDYMEKEKTKVKLLTATSTNSYDMMPLLNFKTNKPIEYGQMRMMVFGKDYAKQNMGSILNFLAKDVSISGNLQLAVANERASELLAATIPTHDPLFIMNMIIQNAEKANLPHSDLQTILFHFYDEGRDVFLPFISLDNKKNAQTEGIVLFNDRKGVKFIQQKGNMDALWLKMLIENGKNGSLELPLENSNHEHESVAFLRVITSKASFKNKTTMNGSQYTYSVKVNITAKVVLKGIPERYAGSDLAPLQTKLEKYLSEQLEQFIRSCCEEGIDPVGFGSFFRSKIRGWNASEFYAAYPSMKSTVSAKVKIIKSGIQK